MPAEVPPLDLDALRGVAEAQGHGPLFVTVSGAHLYVKPTS